MLNKREFTNAQKKLARKGVREVMRSKVGEELLELTIKKESLVKTVRIQRICIIVLIIIGGISWGIKWI